MPDNAMRTWAACQMDGPQWAAAFIRSGTAVAPRAHASPAREAGVPTQTVGFHAKQNSLRLGAAMPPSRDSERRADPAFLPRRPGRSDAFRSNSDQSTRDQLGTNLASRIQVP